MSHMKAIYEAAQEGQDILDGDATLKAIGLTPENIGKIMRQLDEHIYHQE